MSKTEENEVEEEARREAVCVSHNEQRAAKATTGTQEHERRESETAPKGLGKKKKQNK